MSQGLIQHFFPQKKTSSVHRAMTVSDRAFLRKSLGDKQAMNEATQTQCIAVLDRHRCILNTLERNETNETLCEQLLAWREQSHRTIDEHYQQHLDIIHSYADRRRQKCENLSERLQRLMNQLTNQHPSNLDVSMETILQIESDLYSLQRTFLQLTCRPLTLETSQIHLEEAFDLTNLSVSYKQAPYCQLSSAALASNDRYLLMHQNPHLRLLDQDLQEVKTSPWTDDWIRDMCWSTKRACFIVLTTRKVLLIEENLEPRPIIEEPPAATWFSCTCSDSSLYLSTLEWGSAIYELDLLSFDRVRQRWNSPLTCGSHEGIEDIQYSNERLALLICDHLTRQKRLELRSAQSLERIWSYALGGTPSMRLGTCCPLPHDDWLAVNGSERHIYHITNDGKFKGRMIYRSVPYRANLFGSHILALANESSLDLHRFGVL